MNKKILRETNDVERAYYGSKNTDFLYVKIEGPQDGESAFKETKNITLNHCKLALRYPLWHCTNGKVFNTRMLSTCRAAMWYDKNLYLENIKSTGIKAVRECNGVTINNSTFKSKEFGWKSNNLVINKTSLVGEYPFFGSSNLKLNEFKLKGKYSFQYVSNLEISNSYLDTKDAFWHVKNAIIKDSTIVGEYLGWYSENITFINCTIKGTQPLCYVKNLKLINCKFIDCDLAFENSSVNGNIIGDIISIKNPLSGELKITGKTLLIQDDFDRSNGGFSLK